MNAHILLWEDTVNYWWDWGSSRHYYFYLNYTLACCYASSLVASAIHNCILYYLFNWDYIHISILQEEFLVNIQRKSVTGDNNCFSSLNISSKIDLSVNISHQIRFPANLNSIWLVSQMKMLTAIWSFILPFKVIILMPQCDFTNFIIAFLWDSILLLNQNVYIQGALLLTRPSATLDP